MTRKGPRGHLLQGLLWAEAVLCALIGADWLAFGSAAVQAAGLAAIGTGIAMAAATWRGGRRSRRRGCEVPRALLLALARERAGAERVWVNRDEHLVFTVEAAGQWPARRWLVFRADEDQARDFHATAPGGRVALTADMFTVLEAVPEVLREPVGAAVLAGAGREPVIEEEGKASAGGLRRFRLRLQALRAGHLYASAGELRELAGQLQAAELFAPDGSR